MENENIAPRCIGIIMDGNRRWAKARGLSTVAGHHKGYEKLKELIGWMRERDVQNLILYAFSTENWKRSAEEVSYLMELLRTVLLKDIEELAGNDVRIKIVGDRSLFSKDLQELFLQAEEKTCGNTKYTLALALSYGGRAEIRSAFKKLIENGVSDPSEEDIAGALWTAGIPDPDMIIRTSGERRLSGFLSWQSVYSELFFTETLWPDFSKEEFFAMLEEYAHRERRRGV